MLGNYFISIINKHTDICYFHKLSIVIADNYKNELLLQEVKMKEQYYREIEAGNKRYKK